MNPKVKKYIMGIFCCTGSIKTHISSSQTILGPYLNQQHISNLLHVRTVGLYLKMSMSSKYTIKSSFISCKDSQYYMYQTQCIIFEISLKLFEFDYKHCMRSLYKTH